MLANGIAGLATGLAAVFLVPQILRLIRHRDTSGVSVVWAVFGVITNVVWVAYLGVQGLWIATLAPALAVVSYGAVLAAVVRIGTDRRWGAGSALYTASFVGVGATGGLRGLAVLLAVTPAVQLAPQIARIYREARPTGVSPTTWSLAAAEATGWGAYGVLVGDGALVGYGVVTTLGAVLVIGRWWVACGPRQRPARRVGAGVPVASAG